MRDYIEYTVRVFPGGSRHWSVDDLYHREDGPAIEYASGTKLWRKHGILHREGGPAIEYVSGTKAWFMNGEKHREDGPAIEYANGEKSWYLNGRKVKEYDALRKSLKPMELTLAEISELLGYEVKIVK